ncbi:cysteate racemase [Paracoccus aminophilus]|uniref:Aspartate racemase n=1 Tax=Paracoccus aminophilus JCM 7686 TaxID=1367847 RepID=S5XZQ3_PARAH|nr:amino acid racemase [Paracoccus aminophilus]AGT10772.1 aspartate racemase [Paracoccus aminophilus JCM 7686]
MSMGAKKRVGILGGMGPEATILLMQKVLAAVRGGAEGDHIPLIVHQNPQVPSRIARLIEGQGDGRGEDPGPVLAAMARDLQAAGAEALAMPCNTAHHYLPEIAAACRLPFIDMVARAADRAIELTPQGGRIGILASPAVRQVGLYDRALAARGRVAAYPRDDAPVLDAIRQIKAAGAGDAARDELRRASADLAAQGVTVQMLACTELSLIPEAVAVGVTSFDTLDCLTEGIVAFSKG